ncbi:hypothetical protein [Persephonella sp.]
MEKIIDFSLPQGTKSLGKDYNRYLLGDIITETLKTLKTALEKTETKLDNKTNIYTSNNLFIDGRRGSGKTTILITLKDILENRIENRDKSGQPIIDFNNYTFYTVESIIDTSVNVKSITFYFLSWLKEKIENEKEHDIELHKQLIKTLNLFPEALEAEDFKKESYDLYEQLEKSDLNFRKELFQLIDKFLGKDKSNTFIVLFMDDLDISFPVERIQKILTEIFMFLSHPNLIIVAAGDYPNLIYMLKKYVTKKIENKGNDKRNEIGREHDFLTENIAKSFLEKTFASNIVRVYELSYEYIKTLKVKTRGEEPESIKDFLESRVPIIKILSFDSPLFKTLFNGLSTRELVLMLREVDTLSVRNNQVVEKDDFENLYVSNFCFSHVYNRYKKLINDLPEDARFYTQIGDKNKDSEFSFIANNIEELSSERLESGESETFFSKESSILSLLMETKRREKENSLFWLWFLENMIFMNGYFVNFPKLLLLEVINSDLRNLSKFLSFWRNFGYRIEDITKILELYIKKVPIEDKISIQVDNKLSKFIPELILKKENNDYIHLLKIFESVINLFNDEINEHYINMLKRLSDRNSEEKINYVFFLILLENFKDKILNRVDSLRDYKKFSLFLLLYFNLIRILYRFIVEEEKDYFENIDIKYQGIYEKSIKFVEALDKVRDIKKELDWWRHAEKKQIKTVLEHIEETKKLLDLIGIRNSNVKVNIESLLNRIEEDLLYRTEEREKLEDVLKNDYKLKENFEELKKVIGTLKNKVENLVVDNIKTIPIFSILFLLFVVNLKGIRINFSDLGQNSPILKELSKDKPFLELYGDKDVETYIKKFSDLKEIKEIIDFYSGKNENQSNRI